MRVLVRAEEAPVHPPPAVHNVEEEGRLLDGLCGSVVDGGSAETYVHTLKRSGYRLDWSNPAHRLVVHRPTRHHPGKKEMLNLMQHLGVDSGEKWEGLRASLGF